VAPEFKSNSAQSDSVKIAELSAIIQTVRDRVRARYPEPGETTGLYPSASGGSSNGRPQPASVHIADLMPLVHARDAAQTKIAAIGSVNPRAGGLVNKLIQSVKRAIARGLQWFVRDQITFNRETISALEAIIEAFNEHNRALISLAGQMNQQAAWERAELEARAAEANARAQELRIELAARAREAYAALDTRSHELYVALDVRSGELREEAVARARELGAEIAARSSELHQHLERLDPEVKELKDIRKHFVELRADWERRVTTNEIQFLRGVADFQGAFQHRSSLMEANFREIVKAQHADYLSALDRTNVAIQKQVWSDMQKIRAEYDRMIHDELRVIRLRQGIAPVPVSNPASPAPTVDLDYTRFAFRFRGTEEHVRRTEEFYKPFFADCRNVLDIGCGRGEFLELMREMEIPAKGIDLGPESVAACREKGLSAEVADLFAYLGPGTEGEFDGIFASQIVEHLEPAKLPEMIRLCAQSLRRGGVLAIETPNPDCLAIFATYFYLDPTHTRPAPHELLEFYLEEAGMASIEVHELSEAAEAIPEIAELPESFRKRFFGGLDYAIIGRKL
jgi:O-antigen chain-terminating methyltransferase